MRTKDECEKLINNSSLFSIDREKDSVLFSTEKFAFVNILVEYYSVYILPNRPIDSYSMEFMDSVNECVKYFVAAKGTPFLHYFNVVFKQNIVKAKAKAAVDAQRKGIHIADNEDRLIRRIIKYANSINKDINDDSTLSQIASSLGLEMGYLKELVNINRNAVAVSDISLNADGEEISLFDACCSNDPTIEEKIELQDTVTNVLRIIDAVYCSLQERTKPVIRLLMTVYIIKTLSDSQYFDDYLASVSFIEFEEIQTYKKTSHILSAREIALRFNMNEASISRMQANFLDKVRSKC